MTLASALVPLSASCEAHHSAAQSIPDSTWRGLIFDTDLDDLYGMHSTTSQTWKFTLPWDGIYEIIAAADFAASGGGTQRAIKIEVNETTQSADDGTVLSSGDDVAGGTGRVTAIAERRFSAGDVVSVLAYQDSGGALNVSGGGAQTPVVTIRRVGA